MRFILVDRIVELVPGQRITAEKRLPAHEDVFADHFPGFPVVPGVLQIEMIAQACGKCLFAENPARGRPMLARVVSASFREWMRPDETAVITGEVRTSRAAFATTAGRILIDGREICAAELMFSFLPDEKFAPGYRDAVLDAFLAQQTAPVAGAGDVR